VSGDWSRECPSCLAVNPLNTAKCEKCGTSLRAEQQEKPLHPAGGINSKFVYEPIGPGEYVYKTVNGRRNIAKVEMGYEDEENRRGPRWYMVVEEEPYFFREKPPDTWLFPSPDRDTVTRWVKGEKASLSLRDLWTSTQIYFRVFLDLPRECEYSALTLCVVQSWLTEILNVVFYVGIQGEFGGGKTVTGEAIVRLCRHGYQTGNMSPAFLARSIDREKITLFADELDAVAGAENSDLYAIFRHGYRKGGTYSRVNKETMQRETYSIFGCKLFTVHSAVEPALQSRTLPLHVRETGDYKYPLINIEKEHFGGRLHDEFFLWYLDNIFKLRGNSLGLTLDQLDILDRPEKGQRAEDNVNRISEEAEKLRKTLFERKISLLTQSQVGQVSQVTGRNVELEYQCFTLSNLLEVNLDDDIAQIFQQKAVEEAEQREIGFMGILKDVLAKAWEEKQGDRNYLTADGYVKISNKELYALYNKALKDEGYGGVSPSRFKEYLTEFGFNDALNRRKMEILISGEEKPQTRLCNIFTPRVLRKLEIEHNARRETVSEKIVKIQEWISRNRNGGLIDSLQLSDFIKSQGLNPVEIISQLLERGFLFEVNEPARWGVAK
jgi:hypothetical protein